MRHVLIFLIVTGCFFSCKKDQFDNKKNVYCVGYQTNYKCYIACYWKNGEIVYLNGCDSLGEASDIAVSDTNVYITGGFEFDRGARGIELMAVYWKNGVLNYLKNGTSANCIKVVDGDVYIGGAVNYKPCYWKNGILHQLYSKTGYVSGIAIRGNEVHAVGYYLDGVAVAAYWKDGKKYNMVDSLLSFGRCNSIALSGSDVYIGGSEQNHARYWKNGSPVKLTVETRKTFSNISSIAVIGNDVYAAGTESSELTNYVPVAKYWKNGKEHALTDAVSGALVYANSIAVDGNDVYVGGGTNMSPVNYWKNSNSVTLPIDPGGPVKNPIIIINGILIK